MRHKISLAGSLTLTAAEKVAKTCKPLVSELDIAFFRYMRVFADGSKFILCNEPAVLQFLYEDGHYVNTWYDNGKPAADFQPGRHLWAIDKLATDERSDFVGYEMDKHFHYADGIFYCYQQADYIEHFDFISTNPSIYFIKRELLHRFMKYFMVQSKKLMQHACHERIYTPHTAQKVITHPSAMNEQQFIQAISHKQNESRIDWNTGSDDQPSAYRGINLNGVYFTHREKQIIHYLPKGKSAKQIAAVLGISYRTVERHLENIRLKTNLDSKADLIERLFPEMSEFFIN